VVVRVIVRVGVALGVLVAVVDGASVAVGRTAAQKPLRTSRVSAAALPASG
jgi:hypothetical protein